MSYGATDGGSAETRNFNQAYYFCSSFVSRVLLMSQLVFNVMIITPFDLRANRTPRNL